MLNDILYGDYNLASTTQENLLNNLKYRQTKAIEDDQFHELKEYFRNIIAPFYTEWHDIPYPEQCEAHAIFIKCAGDDLIDYVNITKEIQHNIYKLFNSELQYKENKTHEDRIKQANLHTNVSVPFTLNILKNIHSHVIKIFYECTPSEEFQQKKSGGSFIC